MKTLSLLISSLGALFFLSSCTYDPYYGHSSGSVSVGSYYGGVPSYGHSLIRTTHSRWAYDPYRRCYYDNHYRRYYNPVSYSYYSSPPRRYSRAVYPHGYRHGHGRISAPRYDSKKVRLPSNVLVNRRHDRDRDHRSDRNRRSHDQRYDRDRRSRDQRYDRDRRSRDQGNTTRPRRDDRSGNSSRTRTREIQTARHHEAKRIRAREAMIRQRASEARRVRERKSVPVSTPAPRSSRSLHSNIPKTKPLTAPQRTTPNRGRQSGDESRRGRGRSKERS